MIKILVQLILTTILMMAMGFEASPSPRASPTQESLLSYLGRVMMYNFHPPSLFLADNKKEKDHVHNDKSAPLKLGSSNCRHSKLTKEDDDEDEHEKEGKDQIWRGRRPSLKPQMSAKFRHSAKVDADAVAAATVTDPAAAITDLTARKAPSTIRRTTSKPPSTTKATTIDPPSTTPLSGGFPGDDDSAESAIVHQVLMETQILRQRQKVITTTTQPPAATISAAATNGVMVSICNRICR